MIKYNVDLSEYQIKKIQSVYEKDDAIAIRLSYDQITGNGKHKILLTETQKKNIDKSKRLKKGLVLLLMQNKATEQAEIKSHNEEMEKIAKKCKMCKYWVSRNNQQDATL